MRHSRAARTSCLAILILGMAASALAGDPPEAPPVEIRELKMEDLGGKSHSLFGGAETRAVVLVFLSTECPIANQSIPEMNRIAAANEAPAVRFFAVLSDRTVTRTQAARHQREYRISFPVLFDASGELLATLRPTHTPEAFVFDPRGDLKYRGRINDQYAAVGKPKLAASTHELANAIASVRKGEQPEVARTTPVGCPIELPPRGELPHELTYCRDIAPILYQNCAECHRPGEVAPFSLLTYQDAAKRAKWIAELVESRRMPPWKAEPGFGHFVGERRLSDRQVAMFQAWAEAGTPEGNHDDLPPAPEFPSGWRLGPPDLVVRMPEPFTVPGDGPDVFRVFVIPLDMPDDRMVAAVDFRPGNRRVAHHAIFFLDDTGRGRELDAADPGPGYSNFGGPGRGIRPSGGLGGWAPGSVPQFLPDGIGLPLPKGSDVLLQMHYHPSGKPETDQSEVAVYFVKKPVDKMAGGFPLAVFPLNIPPGEARFRVTSSITLPVDVTLLGAAPHMHTLGREMKVTATRPDGQVEPIIWIRDWDWNWQGRYQYREPVRLPKGTRLDLEAFYDNTDDNPANPNSPPKWVRFGQQTSDEMCICFLQATTDQPEDLQTLRRSIMQQTLRRAITGQAQSRP